MGNQLVKTIDAVLQESDPAEFGDDVPAGHIDGRQGMGSESSTSGIKALTSAPVSGNGGLNNQSPLESEAEVSTRIEYAALLQWIKAKDYTTAIGKMEIDVEEYGRFLKEAKSSHLSQPFDVLEHVIRSKFFDSVKSNNKPVSAIYAVLYAALIDDTREAIHFLLIHTSAEFESLCNGIVTSNITLNASWENNGTSNNSTNNDVVRSDVGGDMAIVSTLAKLFELVDRIMNEYAYVESFGLKRILLILRCIQPILERHAMTVMTHWLRTSRFDEYAMTIPSNDWKLYEAYQLSKLENPTSSLPDADSSSPSGTPGASPIHAVPSVRVGGKLEPMKVVLSLDQFSALSQLVETYKAYLHRLYEKGIEEMVAKGHSFVDLGESSHLDLDGLPVIPSPSERQHNIRAFVCEPTQLFMFLQRKSESYKQLETWFLGSALLSAQTPAPTASSPAQGDELAKEGGDGSTTTEKRELEARHSKIAEPPNAAAVFVAQKIDQVFSLLMRSLERAIATKQPEVAQTIAKRTVALCPSFLLSMFLRSIKAALPKHQIDINSDIASAILDFHGEPLEKTPKQALSSLPASPSHTSPRQPNSISTSPSNTSATSQSIWSVGLGGLMNFVGTNASSVASGVLVVGPKFGVSDEMLVTAPRRVVWHGQNVALICASLNDLALCGSYFLRLYQDIEKKVKYFEKSVAHRTVILGSLAHFKISLPLLFDVSSSLSPLTGALLPGVAYHVHQFWRTSYEIGEAEYQAMELNDPWALSAATWLKLNVEQLKPALQAVVTEGWLNQLTAQLTTPLQRLIERKRFSAFGALALDAHLRGLSATLHALLPQASSFVVRQHFSTLKEITTILSLDQETEILEIWNASHDDQSHFLDPSLDTQPATPNKIAVKWRLTAQQVKSYMKCRTEWKATKIDALALQSP